MHLGIPAVHGFCFKLMASSYEIQSPASLLIKNFSPLLSSCYLVSNYLSEKDTQLCKNRKKERKAQRERERERELARPQEQRSLTHSPNYPSGQLPTEKGPGQKQSVHTEANHVKAQCPHAPKEQRES